MAASALAESTGSGSGGDVRPGRLQLVYAAHQTLEDELSTLRAYVAAARKHDESTVPGHDGFSPWAGLEESAAKCISAASRCLRLFSPSREVARSRGMVALTTLYARGAAPHARVIDFLSHIREAFDDAVPVELALCGGRCLQRIDPAAADDYLFDFIRDLVTPTAAADADLFRERLRDRFIAGEAQPAFRLHLRAAVLLQMECAALSEHSEHRIAAYDAARLDALITTATRAELERHEVRCWQDAARHRQLASAAAATPVAPAVAAAAPSTAVVAPKNQEAQRDASAVTAPSSAGASGWRWHAARIGALLLLALLLRFASGPLARALRRALQATRAAPARQRTLTL
ncbi:hypothetical protein NESM_000064900 [Novymonas esmeraldas]|uniref:Uncharacterized protein n=1 Tax=Novymonas esmeraldas TaxID=1808958 RepID=A0AAW0F1W4_9TRYP